MNTSSIPHSIERRVGSPEAPIPAIKPTFFNVFALYDFDYTTLELLATMAGVEQHIVNEMYTTVAIHRADAAKILAAFSEYTQDTYTFDNVKVALHPTFSDIVEAHKLDTSALSTGSGVPIAFVDMMLCDEPVPTREARLVLQMASLMAKHTYTFENVDLQLLEGDSTDGKQE